MIGCWLNKVKYKIWQNPNYRRKYKFYKVNWNKLNWLPKLKKDRLKAKKNENYREFTTSMSTHDYTCSERGGLWLLLASTFTNCNTYTDHFSSNYIPVVLHCRMKELFMEKDDLINSLKKQKDAALAQCGELEKFLDMKRKDSAGLYG